MPKDDHIRYSVGASHENYKKSHRHAPQEVKTRVPVTPGALSRKPAPWLHHMNMSSTIVLHIVYKLQCKELSISLAEHDW